jgi:GT2 family glycosyltransferase/predicted O-methyltransferase YrrM
MFFDFLKRPDNFISGIINKVKPTRAAIVAIEDEQDAAICNGRRFSLGSRPVIRWIKGDGLDDMITRAAIGQATQLFGSEVDYCICTQGIDANRARSILEWASQPVEWWPVSEEDNPQLAQFLKDAGCEPTNFGYWWKWFPERVRPDAPEWILDGDMVITGKPDWFQKWTEGYDVVRVSQDDAEDSHIYGNYSSQVNLDLMLYSGLVSLPPKCNYMSQLVEVLTLQPLLTGHNGKKDMSEQGVIAAAFQKLNPIPIPLYEFPFCRAFQDYIDFGLKGDQGRVWGYHFGNSFIMENPHFERLIAKEIIFSKPESNLIEKFQWLGSQGQWGIPGWTITDGCAKIILDFATAFKGKHVLEIGTSRGRLSAMLATLECKVTTIDHIDRGAFKNLQRLSVEVIIDDAIHFLETNNQYFDLIICDIHGNSPIEWKHYSKPLIKRIKSGSTLIISNALLFKIPEWQQETGVQWFLKRLPKNWQITLFSQSLPGIAVVTSKRKTEKEFISNRFIDRFPIIPSVKQQVSNLKGFRQMISWFKLYTKIIIIRQSTLFDKKYYLQKNPDVKLSGISAVKHYLLYGGFEGRNPSEKFDSSFYLAENPDIKEKGMNPLVHYLQFGKEEGRKLSANNCDEFSGKPKHRLTKLGGKNNIMPVFSDCLSYPTNFTILVLYKGNEDKLKMTLNSLSQQSFKHWNCFVLMHSANNETLTNEKINKIINNHSPDQFEFINIIEPFFAFLEKKKGFVGFLQEGEIVRPDCLWQFYNERDENTELIYSDHDIINEQNQHIDPWFTFNWSPDLLLSQNYIGGFYVASSELFLSNYKPLKSKQLLLEKIETSLAWRYNILLNISNKTNSIRRIPEVLWSCPQQSEKALQYEYFDECKEIILFLDNQGLNTSIDNYLNGKIRHVNWAIENEPLVSIIIPTTGNLKYLKICIDSLSEITEYKNFEIIILDNGKGKYPAGIDYARTKGIQIIEVYENFNWSKLNNIGVKHAKGEFLLFLNDDIEVIEPKWLTEMLRQSSRKDIGVVGSLLLYPTEAIQHAGVFLVDHGGGARHWFYKQKLSEGSYQNLDQCVREVSANTGACLMVSRLLFNEIGGFDENLALVGNDVDFCLRCIEAGYRNLWTPHSKLIHHESVTRKAAPIEKDEKAMWARWGKFFKEGDYYYNPNLSLEKEDCSVKHSSNYFSPNNNYDFYAGRKTKLQKEKESVQFVPKILQQPNFGVNIISYIRAEMGIGEAARGNAKALKAANIPFGVFNFEKGNPSKMNDLTMQYREMTKAVFDFNILQINADFTPFVIKNLGKDFFEKKYTIGFWAWELSKFPEKWKNSFNLVDEIWVPSSFVNKAVSLLSPVPVITIPHVINAVNIREVKSLSNRASFNIPENAFVFLSMFDVHSIIERKNPFGSIHAFKNAFKADDSSVLLAIKVNNPDALTLKELNKSIGDYKNILVIKKHLTRQETNCLLASIDCFLSLHRSEGFGLGPAEAMARGKVAMLTNWSGNTEYMTSDNCIPISFTLNQIGKDLGPYEKHQYWASPDLEEASAKMKSISLDKPLVKKIGEQAYKTINEQFSAKKIGELMLNRLFTISRKLY